MMWTYPLLTVVLAFYGWTLIKRLAQGREAQDLYTSVISTLEQLENDAEQAWKQNPQFLPEYIELRILAKVADIEKRLELIDRYYKSRTKSSVDGKKQMKELRRLLTAAPDLIQVSAQTSSTQTRIIEVHGLINTMIGNLIEENYEYVNTIRKWWKFPIEF